MAEAPAWQRPVSGSYPDPAMLALPGRRRLEAWLRTGPQPPLTHLTGARLTGVGDGTADAELPASEWLLNPAGLIGGGTLAILADIAFGCAVETQLPAATPYTTAELSLTFLRPARPGGTLSAHGQAIHLGRRIGLSEAFVIDPRGGDRLIAHGTSRLAVLPPLERVPEQGDRSAGGTGDGPGGADPYERDPELDGVVPQRIWDELPGAEVLRRQIAGELPTPPIQRLTGLELVAAGDGGATMTMPASEWLNSPAGRLQGGTIAMLADTAMVSAVAATADPGTAVAGLDLKVNFLRPVLADGRPLTARAELAHAGRTLAVTRARIENADGRPVALATGTGMHLPATPASLGPDAELSEA